MYLFLTLPIPSDIEIPQSCQLTTHDQSSPSQVLHLTALPESGSSPKTVCENDIDNHPQRLEVFLQTAPGVPRIIHALHSRQLLSFAHTSTAIAFHLSPAALNQKHTRLIAPLMQFALNSESELIDPLPYSREWVFNAVRRTTNDYEVNEYQRFLSLVKEQDSLNVNLRPYQQRAVAWMLSRELRLSDILFEYPLLQLLHDPITNYTKIYEQCDDAQRKTPIWGGSGGLLCDEMGLGKTVALMQLVLCNPYTKTLSKLPERSEVVCIYCQGRLEDTDFKCAECGGGVHSSCLPGFRKQEQNSAKQIVCEKCKETMSKLCHESTPITALPSSRATLVVVPTALLPQWESELRKHVKNSLDVVIFRGMKVAYVPQKRLQVADVVLTTYDALRADVYSARAIRTPRTAGRYKIKYPPTPVPLLTLQWHRVAFDESQMLSAKGSRVAEMAGFLYARFRWCVTGTPMKSRLTDAGNLFEMLQLTYRGEAIDWVRLFQSSCYSEDQERLKALLRRVMWRTSKADIGPEELDLPPQHVEFVRTRFGPVEMYHYQSLLQIVRSVICRYKTQMNNREMKMSQDLLTMLRQACTHPQIGASGRRLLSNAYRTLGVGSGQRRPRRENAVQKATKKAENPLDMNDVLEALVAKANVECEEVLRSLVASTNGLAAAHLLQFSLLPPRSPVVDGLVKAIQLYRDVLRISDENKHIARLDEIQLMHVLFNLNDAFKSAEQAKAALCSSPETERKREALEKLRSMGRTMREGQLLEQVDKLKQKYIADARGDLAVTTAYYNDIVKKLGAAPIIEAEKDADEDEDDDEPEEEVLERVCAAQRSGKPKWWEVALATLLEEKKHEAFLMRIVEKLIETLPGRGLGAKTLTNRLSSFHSLSIVIASELRELQTARKSFKDTLLQLPGSRDPTAQEVSESGQCRGCREFGTGLKCLHCRSEKLIIAVEKHLYSLQEELDEETLLPDHYFEGQEVGDDDDEEEDLPVRADPRTIVNSAFIPQSRNPKPTSTIMSRIRYVSEVETILKGLATIVRKKKNPDVISEMTGWFERWELLKEEHAAARKVFEAQRSYLASLDEVNMALMRLSVLEDGVDVNALSELEARHRVPRGSLGPLRTQFEAEKASAEAEFCTKRGSVVYLRSLQKGTESQVTGKRKQKGPNSLVNCPVCLFEFDETLTRIAVMACGHVFCCDCMLALIKKVDLQRRIEAISCPTCRIRSVIDEINFTSTTPGPSRKKPRSEDRHGSPSSGSGDVTELELELGEQIPPPKQEIERRGTRSSFYLPREKVQGHFGAKVSATLRLIRGIWKMDASIKILVFSEWAEVLSLMAHSLKTNAILFCNASSVGTREFANVVEEFKTSEYTNVILLPLRRAGAGLNLTEAGHVILMEPSMDISMEAQAVGRIHRIGQTKVTYVHRVMMNYTIEEKILSLGDRLREEQSEKRGSIELKDALGAISAEKPTSTVAPLTVETLCS